ncbi:TetR-like C-terminal domain-containing protein, partial [Streptomyces hygroscopicus]|uniref:TetR-like C-terminal domain-containing protein n=1 Tax=Streptomyces hygroscopicus TaxID=1912 RepID=UPI0027E304A6
MATRSASCATPTPTAHPPSRSWACSWRTTSATPEPASASCARPSAPRAGPTAFETIVTRAVERGELPDTPRSPRVVNLPFDLLRHDMLTTMRAVPDASIVEIVDEVWLPLLAAPGTLPGGHGGHGG